MLRRSVLFAVCLCCVAQEESGRIVGTVTDPNQASVPRATVTITSAATKQVTSVTTGDQGNYTVTPLNPGFYNVSVTATGFQTSVVQNVQVQVNQSARADVHLQLGSTATTVEVTAAAPLLNSESASLHRAPFFTVFFCAAYCVNPNNPYRSRATPSRENP